MGKHSTNPGHSALRRWSPLALRFAPLACLLLCAVALVALRWNDALTVGIGLMALDTGHYVSMAESLRHGAIHPFLSLNAPGYSIMLALMPAPLNVTTALVASVLAFLASMVLLYVAALRYGGVAAATVSGASWLLLFHSSPKTPLLPISDDLFVAVALLGLLARRPVAVGIAGGFAMLTRPVGFVLTTLLAVRQWNWRRALLVLAIAATLYAPYPVAIHSLSGQWTLTGKHAVNWQVAPYWMAGVRRAELTALTERFGTIQPELAALGGLYGAPPPPTDDRVLAVISKPQRARARLFLDVPFRMRTNLHIWWVALRQIAPLPLLMLALLGACALAWYRRAGPLCDAACLVTLSLTWLPYYYIGHRGMLAAFAALALLAGASTLPVVRWVRHIKSAGSL